MKKTVCNKCNSEITNCNFKKHFDSCDGKGPYRPLSHCCWCKEDVDNFQDVANHIRWCKNNPARDSYNKNLDYQRSKITEHSREKQALAIKKAHTEGKYKEANRNKIGKSGTPHTAETKEHLRLKALASPHRRLLRSIREYTKKDGSIIKLDSSWEEALAIRLDELNIDWIRPSPIKWVDSAGVSHNYFPDFYLKDFDIFLDPKNEQAVKVQKDKIECLTRQLKNLIIITTLEGCKTFNPQLKKE